MLNKASQARFLRRLLIYIYTYRIYRGWAFESPFTTPGGGFLHTMIVSKECFSPPSHCFPEGWMVIDEIDRRIVRKAFLKY